MKTAIVGFTGSGKSSMARAIAKITSDPVLHLDTVHFTADWQRRPLPEARALVESFCDREGWIIEGNYQSLQLQRRFAEADVILFLNINRFRCFRQAVHRAFRNRGRQREDLAEGCYDRLTLSFLTWILLGSRTKRWTQFYRDLAEQYPQKFVELKSPQEMRDWLASLQQAHDL